MADHIDPTAFLEDLQHVFTEGASGEGVNLDPQLCKFLVAGLGGAVSTVKALRFLAEEGGLLQRLTLPDPAPRSPTERRQLAAMARPLSSDNRVVAFPCQFGPALVPSAGGTAA